MRLVWVLVVAALVVLGAVVWVMHDMDKKLSETNGTVSKTAQVLDWFTDSSGIVITVNVDGKLYRLYTNADMINVSEPVRVVFQSGKPIAVVQDDRAYGIKDWDVLKTLEDMPKIKKSG